MDRAPRPRGTGAQRARFWMVILHRQLLVGMLRGRLRIARPTVRPAARALCSRDLDEELGLRRSAMSKALRRQPQQPQPQRQQQRQRYKEPQAEDPRATGPVARIATGSANHWTTQSYC